MKSKILNICIIFLCLFVLTELIFNKTLVFNTINISLNIWVKNLIPSLFPFFVISDILINYNITSYIPKFIKKFLCKLFNIKEEILTIFFLSLLSGFPSNARNTRTFYDNKLITTNEANHALIFTHFANPLFILSTTSVFFLFNEKLGIILLLTHYLSNIILALIFRKNNTISNINSNIVNTKSQSFGTIFTSAIVKSINTLLLILGILTCFLIISSIIINIINLNSYNQTLLKGILEITMGLKDLGMLPLKEIYKVVIASAFIAFGGLSVHMQVISQLIGTDIKYHYFLVGRLFGTIISIIISIILYILIL